MCAIRLTPLIGNFSEFVLTLEMRLFFLHFVVLTTLQFMDKIRKTRIIFLQYFWCYLISSLLKTMPRQAINSQIVQ